MSLTAALSRAPNASKAGVGPFQNRSSTESNNGMSVRSVASVRNRKAFSRSRASVAASAPAPTAFTRQSRQSAGIEYDDFRSGGNDFVKGGGGIKIRTHDPDITLLAQQSNQCFAQQPILSQQKNIRYRRNIHQTLHFWSYHSWSRVVPSTTPSPTFQSRGRDCINP